MSDPTKEAQARLLERYSMQWPHHGTAAQAILLAGAASLRAPSAIGELVGICQWMEKTFDMGADRSQVADPAIIARRDIYAGILARIVELKEGA